MATLCRCLDMRSAYLAPDRMDISGSIKCFRRHIQTPREGHMMWRLPGKMKKRRIFAYIRFGLGRRLGSRRSNPTRKAHALTCVDDADVHRAFPRRVRAPRADKGRLLGHGHTEPLGRSTCADSNHLVQRRVSKALQRRGKVSES